MSDPLETLLLAVGSAHDTAESVDHRRSQRITARKRESEAIERALRTPKVFRARTGDASITSLYGAKRDSRKMNNAVRKVENGLERMLERVDPWIGGAGAPKVGSSSSAMEGRMFPSSNGIPSASELLHALSSQNNTLPTPFSTTSISHYAFANPTTMQTFGQASASQAPSLRNLVLFSELHPLISPLALSTATSIPYPYFVSHHNMPSATALASSNPSSMLSAFSTLSASSNLPRGFPSHPSSESTMASLHAQSTIDSSFTIVGRAPKRISEMHIHLDSPSSSLSDEHVDSRLHYPSSTPPSPHSDEDSTSTVRDISTDHLHMAGIEQSNSPALLPGCGIYSEYIHDLRTVCSHCSAAGRLKSKKKPLVDSLLLLAFFGDGIKKTPNGLGYIIDDSNLARELMNIVSSHIRPPSRGTNNSYDNWKRAMGKTFRKSGTFFTPKDEDTTRYARHVEEHLLRIFERKKNPSHDDMN
jgi:hypothetical protein